ncbi:MAG: hypothetical protein ACN6O7_22930 [Sphingobacterium sp.]
MRKKNNIFLISILGITISFLQISCSIQTFDCHHLKYLSLSKIDHNRQHVNFSYGLSSADESFEDDRILFRKSNLSKSDKIKALEEYLCFYKNETISDKMYSQKYGRIHNRIKLSKENTKFPVEIEALYSLTTLLFDDNVAISPEIIDKKTGKICNFERRDVDSVYKIYRVWLKKMKKDGFTNMVWPLKNTKYMWLGEDVVDHIETLMRKRDIE